MDRYHQSDHSSLAIIIITLLTYTINLIRTDPITTPILRILEGTRHDDWPNMAKIKDRIYNNGMKSTEISHNLYNGSENDDRNECFYCQFNKITIYLLHNRPSIYGPMAAAIAEGLMSTPPYQYAGYRHTWKVCSIKCRPNLSNRLVPIGYIDRWQPAVSSDPRRQSDRWERTVCAAMWRNLCAGHEIASFWARAIGAWQIYPNATHF